MYLLLMNVANVTGTLLIQNPKHHFPHSNPLRNKPLRTLNPIPPTLNERNQLRALDDPMIRTPADTNLQPPLALPIAPINVPHPLGPSNSDNSHSSSRYKDWRRAFSISYTSDVRNRKRTPSFGHFGRC